MIGVAVSVILNTLALILAARILDIALRIIPALLMVGLSQSAMALLQGTDESLHISGLIISVVIYFAGLKFFTGESLWALFKLTIVSMLLAVAIVLTLARLFR